MIPFAGALSFFQTLFTLLPLPVRLFVVTMVLLKLGINLLVLAVDRYFS